MRSSGSTDHGESLLEVMMSVAILGIAFAAILGGMVTSIIGTDVHQEQSEGTTILLSAAEALKDADTTFVRCADAAAYEAALAAVPVPSSWSAPRVALVRHWDGSSFQSTCYDTPALGRVLRLQEIVVEVSSPTGRSVERLSVVKRDDA